LGGRYGSRDKRGRTDHDDAGLLAFPNGSRDDQADCFAYAAADTTSTPSINPGDLARVLDDADLTQTPGWRV